MEEEDEEEKEGGGVGGMEKRWQEPVGKNFLCQMLQNAD
jgi:hypothetical protein